MFTWTSGSNITLTGQVLGRLDTGGLVYFAFSSLNFTGVTSIGSFGLTLGSQQITRR